jgi:hypothetical protein
MCGKILAKESQRDALPEVLMEAMATRSPLSFPQ